MQRNILEQRVLDLYLSGIHTAGAIAKELGVPDQRDVAKIIDSPIFQKRVMEAERDLTASVMGRFKRNVHAAAYRMEKLSEQQQDRRVQFQATKDLLDRADTAPKQREYFTPNDYIDLLREFAKEKDGNEAHEEREDSTNPLSQEE